MNKPTVAIIIGTRPEAIKLSPLIKVFQSCKEINTKVILTGQHIEMVDQVLKLFEIKENNNLRLMKPNQSLSYITSNALNGLSKIFQEITPNIVLVQGDTSTAFAAALAAFYLKIKIGHVEAGLRSNNNLDPYPEEANRRLISQIASLHFAPTLAAKENLLKENVPGEIFLTGNTVIDALLISSKKAKKLHITNLDWEKHVIFSTIHRRENWGENLYSIATTLKEILEEYNNLQLLMPMHKNKQVREPLIKILDNHPRAFLVEPLNYIDCVSAIKHSYFLLTDSGGLQEEAPSLGKPVLVLRKNTERPEAIAAGNSILVGSDKKKIKIETQKLLTNNNHYQTMSHAINPFGDGHSSKRILKACLNIMH